MLLPVRKRNPIRIVFDGQSMNLWPPIESTPGQLWEDGRGPYPNRLMENRTEAWANVAISNTGWGSGQVGTLSYTASTRVFPQARNLSGYKDILIMSGGQGDLFPGEIMAPVDGVVTYQRAVAYADAARAAGFHKIIATTLPDIGIGAPLPITSVEKQYILDHNAALLADSLDGFDGIADWGITPLNDATNSTYFQADQVHFKPPSATVAANAVRSVLDAVIATL